MKAWFDAHPNTGWLLWFLASMYWVRETFESASDGAWVMLAVSALFAFVSTLASIRWWDRT